MRSNYVKYTEFKISHCCRIGEGDLRCSGVYWSRGLMALGEWEVKLKLNENEKNTKIKRNCEREEKKFESRYNVVLFFT